MGNELNSIKNLRGFVNKAHKSLFAILILNELTKYIDLVIHQNTNELVSSHILWMTQDISVCLFSCSLYVITRLFSDVFSPHCTK